MIINNNRGLNTNSVRQDEKVNDKGSEAWQPWKCTAQMPCCRQQGEQKPLCLHSRSAPGQRTMPAGPRPLSQPLAQELRSILAKSPRSCAASEAPPPQPSLLPPLPAGVRAACGLQAPVPTPHHLSQHLGPPITLAHQILSTSQRTSASIRGPILRSLWV